jgi:hypothetical protein
LLGEPINNAAGIDAASLLGEPINDAANDVSDHE